MQQRIKKILKHIDHLLEKYGDSNSYIRKALSGNDNELWDFLLSNELWGGAGSIADQSVLVNKADRKVLESLLIDLGEMQMKAGKVNERTEMWVSAFKEWRKQ